MTACSSPVSDGPRSRRAASRAAYATGAVATIGASRSITSTGRNPALGVVMERVTYQRRAARHALPNVERAALRPPSPSVVQGGSYLPEPDAVPLNGNDVSCVCGFEYGRFFAPATALSVRFQMMSPRFMSDS